MRMGLLGRCVVLYLVVVIVRSQSSDEVIEIVNRVADLTKITTSGDRNTTNGAQPTTSSDSSASNSSQPTPSSDPNARNSAQPTTSSDRIAPNSAQPTTSSVRIAPNSAQPTTSNGQNGTTSAKPTTSIDRNTAQPTTSDMANVPPTTAQPEQTYKEAEKEITDFVNSIMRQILPKVIGGAGGASLSSPCTGAMMKLFANVRRMRGWTLKMLDSMSKPSSAILEGRAYSMGGYDQCVGIAVDGKGRETADPATEMFRGMSCRLKAEFPRVVIQRATEYHKGLVNETQLGKLKDLIQVIPFIPIKSTFMAHFLDLCFPSTCNNEDIHQLIKLIPFPGTVTLDRCETRRDASADGVQVMIVIILLVLVGVVVLSTFIDWLLHSHTSEDGVQRRDKRCVGVCVSFSLCSNTRSLTANVEEDSEGAKRAVRGVLVASVAWLILGRTYLFPHEEYYFHLSMLKNLEIYRNDALSTLIVAYPLAMDSLCVCFGFLLTFSLWSNAVKQKNVKVNIMNLIIQNYVRLLVPLLPWLCFILILPLLGSGPFWGDIMDPNLEGCRANAGAFFGMYINFLSKEQQCFPNSFFVSCLGQLTLAGILLSWLMARNMKVGVLLSVFLTLVANVTVGILTFKHDIPSSYTGYTKDDFTNVFWQVNMSLPMIHVGPYVAGLLAGILAARTDTRRRNRRCLSVIGWLTCLAILYSVLLGLYQSRKGSSSQLWAALFASFHKTAFGLCVAWVLVACSYGIGGFVNAVLSWKVWDSLYKLSYTAYLYHFVIISFLVSTAREHYSFSHIELILRATSYLVASYAISYLSYMLLEGPIRSIRSALCAKQKMDLTPFNTYMQQQPELVSKGTVEGACKLWAITESRAS